MARIARDPLLWLGLAFLFFLFFMPVLAPIFAALFPATNPPVYPFDSFFDLWLNQAILVALSSVFAAAIGLGATIVATREWGRDMQPMLEAIATIGQTFPPVAVLALAVPAFGYGAVPTLIALGAYGVLPVLQNSLAGLATIPQAPREAAEGMGLTPFQVLRQVELPLAAPAILAGIRISVVINIGTAAIGSTVGAVTLGTPIIGGFVTGQLGYVIQGAVVAGLFAIVTDEGFARLARRWRKADG